MQSSFNQVEDFLMDEKFRSWVLAPTPELNSYWGEWLENNHVKKDLFEQAEHMARNIEFSTYKASAESKEDILENIQTETQDWNKTRIPSFWNNWLKVAAVLVLGFGMGYILSQLNFNPFDAFSDSNMVTLENPYGLRSHYSLSDGSEIYLNAGSSIEFPEKFTTSVRKVKLKGEAYFEVKSDKNRPFEVISDNLSVTVLGTKFNFNSENGQNAVALVEGKVEYQEKTTGSSIILKPGQMASFSQNDSKFYLTDFDKDQVMGWKDGKLVFRDANLQQVKTKLEKWYGLSISIENPGKSSRWSYTASFSNESLETVLLNMSTVKNFSYEIKGNEILIKF